MPQSRNLCNYIFLRKWEHWTYTFDFGKNDKVTLHFPQFSTRHFSNFFFFCFFPCAIAKIVDEYVAQHAYSDNPTQNQDDHTDHH